MICGLAQLNTCSGEASLHMHGRVWCQAYILACRKAIYALISKGALDVSAPCI